LDLSAADKAMLSDSTNRVTADVGRAEAAAQKAEASATAADLAAKRATKAFELGQKK
jgi:hypothetical protein